MTTEQNRAEETEREVEERLASIYEAAGVAMFRLAVEAEGRFRFAFVNQAFLCTTGLTAAQVVGKRVDEVIPEPALSMALQRYACAIRQKQLVRWEETSDYPTGELVGEVSVAPVFDDSGACTHLIGAVHDLTARRRAEAALRESEERYRVFMDSSSDMAFLKDESFRHVMVNRKYAAFFGTRTPEVLGKTDFDLMPRRMAEGCRRTDEEALAKGQVVTSEERVGEAVFQTLKFPVPLPGGRVGVGGFLRDVTAQRRAEGALAQERSLMRALMDTVPDYVYFKDADSRFLRVSTSHARMFGVGDPAQAVGKTDFDFFTEQHAREAYEDERAILRTGQPVIKEERETWADRPDTWVSTTKMPLRDETGAVIGTFGISRDITERKRSEAERERLIGELREALANVRTLRGLLPICASCKKIRDDSGYWNQLDRYVFEHSEAVFSHDICPDCLQKLYPDLVEDDAPPGG